MRRFSLFCAGVLAWVFIGTPAVMAGFWLEPGQSLRADTLESLVEEQLPQIFGQRRRTLQIDQPRLPMRNPATIAGYLELQDFRQDEKSGRFHATLHVELENGIASDIPVRGRSKEEIEVAILGSVVPRGQVVRDADLDFVWMEMRRLPADGLISAEELTGLEAKRRLMPGRVVRARDLQQQRLVRKGEVVELRYVSTGLQLNTIGRALQDGERGERIAIENIDSDRRIQARVSGPKQVTVSGD